MSNISFSGLLWGLLLLHSFAAFVNHIDDTDEIFGYYEPLHYLMQGSGMQTWEYAPEFALRSYAFLMPLLCSCKPFTAFSSLTGIDMFRFIRVIIGCWMAYCEANFIHTIGITFGGSSTLYLATLFATSPGMFYCSTSFLPSSFCAGFMMLAAVSWMKNQGWQTIAWGCMGAIFTGWPFCCLLFFPFGVHLLVTQPTMLHRLLLCLQGVLVLCTVLGVCSAIDIAMYDKLTSPLLNILLYNAVGGSGDELYGVEPAAYYIRNLLLTLGVVWPLAAVAPLLILRSLIHNYLEGTSCQVEAKKLVLCMPPLLWLALLFRRPHKEERFIYPVYPLMIAAAFFSIDKLADLALGLVLLPGNRRLWRIGYRSISGAALVTAALMGASRITSNYNNFYGYLDLWSQTHAIVASRPGRSSVCIGGDWFTFPSHFFLPTRARLEFVRDGFNGQLPYHFSAVNGTSATPVQSFNDQNRAEEARYVDMAACDFVVLHLHRQSESNQLEETIQATPTRFRYLTSTLVLDAANSPSLTRAFYIPGRSIKANKYNEYALFEQIRS